MGRTVTEERKAQMREYYQRNKERIKAKARERHNPERKRCLNLQRNYGITSKQYDSMYAEQEGKCFICGDAHEVLHVDHNHNTGEVRKLLCICCNTAFGKARESVPILEKLLEYGRMYGTDS